LTYPNKKPGHRRKIIKISRESGL